MKKVKCISKIYGTHFDGNWKCLEVGRSYLCRDSVDYDFGLGKVPTYVVDAISYSGCTPRSLFINDDINNNYSIY